MQCVQKAVSSENPVSSSWDTSFMFTTTLLHSPVFPEVGSTMVPPGFRKPSLSASSIILTAIRSLMDPPALKYSHFATVCANMKGPVNTNISYKTLLKCKWHVKVMCMQSICELCIKYMQVTNSRYKSTHHAPYTLPSKDMTRWRGVLWCIPTIQLFEHLPSPGKWLIIVFQAFKHQRLKL